MVARAQKDRLGLAAHGIDTARAFRVNAEAGAYAGLAFGLQGALVAFTLPLLVGLLRCLAVCRDYQPRSDQVAPRNGSDKSRAVACFTSSVCFARYAPAYFAAFFKSATQCSGWRCTYASYSFGPPT